MSQLLGLISQSLDAGKVSQISQQIGASPQQTQSALSAALPMLVGGLAKNASSPEGAQSIAGALDRDHDGGVLDSLGGLLGQAGGQGGLGALLGGQQQQGGLGGLLGMVGSLVTDAPGPGSTRSVNGDGILGHILGGKRGAVEQGVARASGLNGSQVAQLLALVAPIVMAAIGRAKQSQGLDAGGVSDLLQQESGQLGGGQAGGILGSLLDQDDDGSVADDVAKIGAQLAGKNILGGLFG